MSSSVISVTGIMAAHNAATTIGGALGSALRQLPATGEILVVNDASSDSTDRVVRSIADSRVRLISTQENVGSGIARQLGLEAARGDVVAILDADDLWVPGHLRRSVKALERAEVSFASALRVGPSRVAARPTRMARLCPVEVRAALAIHNPLVHSTCVGRRSAFTSAGGYRDLRRGQDYDLWLRMSTRGIKVVKGSWIGAIYRQSRTQVSRQPNYLDFIGADEQYVQARKDFLEELVSEGLDGPDALAEQFTRFRMGLVPHMNRRYYRGLLGLAGQRRRVP